MTAKRPVEEYHMPFGKYRGECIVDVERSYLVWLLEQDWFLEKYEDLAEAIEEVLEIRARSGED